MSMIKRVAKAIYKAREDNITRPLRDDVTLEAMARAAIEAMREPSEDMLEVGSIARLKAWDDVTEPDKRFKGWPTEIEYHETAETFKSMIDEALVDRDKGDE